MFGGFKNNEYFLGHGDCVGLCVCVCVGVGGGVITKLDYNGSRFYAF